MSAAEKNHADGSEGSVITDEGFDGKLKLAAESPPVYGTQNRKEAFIREALLLRQALSLCRSLLDPEQRFEAAYFEAVRTLLTRITGEGKPLSLKEINVRINELLKASIKSDGVINLFSDAISTVIGQCEMWVGD